MVARDVAKQGVRPSTAPDLRLISEDERLTWAEAIERWYRLSTLRPNTRAAYRGDLLQFGGFLESQGVTHPGDVRSAHVRGFLAAHKWADTTKRRKCDAISTFYNDLLEDEEPSVTRNPVTRNIRPPRRRTVRGPVPTAEETESLRRATRGPLESAVFAVFVGMGLRRAEVLSLTVGPWLHRDAEIVIVGKGGHERRVPTDAAREAVEAYLPVRSDTDSGALFIQERGKCRGQPVTEKVLWRMMRRWCKRAGVPDRSFTLHSLRRRFGTSLGQAGADLATIRDLLGHDSVETTDIYLHTDAGRMRAAVERLAGQRMSVNAPAQVGEGQREVQGGCGRVAMPEDALHRMQVAAAPQQEGRSGMPQTVGGRPWAIHASAGQRPSQQTG